MRRKPLQRGSRLGLALACLPLALSACGESLVAPARELVLPRAQQSGEVPEGLAPNGVPYRNPGYRHATGRDGGAKLTARALMDRHGQTTLELTTGELGGTASDPITRLQVKYLAPDGSLVWTANEASVNAATAERTFEGLIRHGFLRVQAHVTVPNASGKGTRTGVVTVEERINLRPDLSPRSIAAPAQTYVGTSVDFAVAVFELNGDVSATADCVFYVDGVETARSENIWVGEGDEVTCLLSYAFPSAGIHTVEVAVQDVTPADFDESNNRIATTIEVVAATAALHGSATARDAQYKHAVMVETCCERYETIREYRDVAAQLYGGAAHPLVWPAAVRVVQSSDGAAQHVSNVRLSLSSPSGCAATFNSSTKITLCTNGGLTWLSATRSSGRATYFAQIYSREQAEVCKVWYGSWCLQWETYWWWKQTYYYYLIENYGGGYTALGSDYEFDVLIEDAAGTTFRSDPVVIQLGEPGALEGGWWGRFGRRTF